jgi:hypothetical protein
MVRLFIALFFSFFSGVLFAQEGIEKIDISSFPKIKIHFREAKQKKLNQESIYLLESSSSLKKEIDSLQLIRKDTKRPIYVVFSIQASSWENNKTSQKIVGSLLDSLESNDLVGLHFFGKKTEALEFGLNAIQAKDRLNGLNIGDGNNLFENLGVLFTKLPDSKLPIVVVSIALDSVNDGLDLDKLIFEKSKKEMIPILVIGREERPNLNLAKATSGAFFPVFDYNIVGPVQNALYQVQKTPPILEYTTEFSEFSDSILNRKVEIELEVGNKKYSSSYTVNLLTVIQGFFSDVEFFLGIMLALLFVLFLIAYALYQRKKRLQWEEYVRKQEEIRKSDLYYHENKSTANIKSSERGRLIKTQEIDEKEWQRFEEEELEMDYADDPDLDISDNSESSEFGTEIGKDLPPGEIYSKVFLIQKEGPNPGRQFVIYQEETNVGRSPDNHLVLLDTTVSHKHAKIKKINGIYYIYDLVSERGVYINGKKLLKPRPLFDFDEIRLGKIMLLFRGN